MAQFTTDLSHSLEDKRMLRIETHSTQKTQLQLSHVVASIMQQFLPEHLQLNKAEHSKLRTFYLNILTVLSTRVSSHATLVALLYINRLCQQSGCSLNANKSLEILCVALMFADLTVNDASVPVPLWIQVCGLERSKVMNMKHNFLNMIKFDLHVTENQYTEWVKFVSSTMKNAELVPMTPCYTPISAISGGYGFGFQSFLIDPLTPPQSSQPFVNFKRRESMNRAFMF